jgi:zonular occludens toxin Zot
MYTGRPGTGKTYSLVHKVFKLLKKGKIVYSNFQITWEGTKKYPKSNLKYWKNLNELLYVENAYIVIDEAHFYFNSRQWKNMPIDWLRKLAQHRKDGVHILGTVQNIRRIDVVVRELIDYWFDCRMFLFWVVQTEFDIDEDTMKKYPLKRNFLLFTKKRAKRYDTLAKITV